MTADDIGVETVLTLLTRAGIPVANVDPRTIDYYLRHGYTPHQIAVDIYRIPITAIQPAQETAP